MRHKSALRVRGWYETEEKLEVTIRRSESGYLQTSKGLAQRTWLNGSGYNDPRIGAFVGHELTRHIDPDGRLVAVDGIGAYVGRLQAAMRARRASRLRSSERELRELIQQNWKRQITDLAGMTLSLGEAVETTFPFRLPGGAEIAMPQKFLALRFVACPAGQCVVVLQDYQSGDPALGTYVRAALQGDLILLVEGDRARPTGSRVTASTSRVIDPETMRIYEEDGSETARFTLDLPGRGPILFERTDERRRRFEYH